MLALTQLVFPGYFRRRTIELGHYVGVRCGIELIAMAGERLKSTGYCEVSGVCTRPEFAGRGLAATLSSMVVTLGIAGARRKPYLRMRQRKCTRSSAVREARLQGAGGTAAVARSAKLTGC